MIKRLKVFICSTYSDLIKERQAVIDTINNLQFQNASMEYFGARPDKPIETCLTEVRDSDLLIIILGHRYGSTVPGMNISFAELEYSEGIKLKKPCLVYMKDENFPTLLSNFELNQKKA